MRNPSTKQKPVVVLDKSFVQAAKPQHVASLADDYLLTVTSSFYYEAFQEPDDSRRKIFGSLPEFRRIHTPKLYSFERQNHAPADSIETPQLEVNQEFVDGIRTLTDAERQAVCDFESHVVRPQVHFWKQIMECGVVGFDQSELDAVRGDHSSFIGLCERLRDVPVIRRIAMEMGMEFWRLIDYRWITFRLIQTSVLHGLVLRHLYPNPAQRRKDDDLEHDVHDIDNLTLGVHSAAFATNESRHDFRKLGWRFHFLRAEGTLIQIVRESGHPTICVIHGHQAK